MAIQDIEKLGVFYLGRLWNPDTKAVEDTPLLYDARDLTTHAACFGMTGSGKTGLCLALLEEAAIDGIPAIAIDPKGDLGNLLLTFPELRPADFEPWIDPGEAARDGSDVAAHAAKVAERWRTGLAASGQDGERIQRLRDAAEIAIYTPGSLAGRPLSVLRSLTAPSPEVASDVEAARERLLAAVSALLGLLGIDADPIRSREHILLSHLIEDAWAAGRDVELASLVREIHTPPIDRVGALDLESFFPAKERAGLALALNNLLASPGFAAWREGDPLDVRRLLWTPEGKPRVSILSIAHLSDPERMFFVSLLLGEIVAWMRAQPGTSSLRALLYMDEVLGYLPPVANPPSKLPMLTLLKQGRAFGLGVVLATQNPVDIDYKALANAGTWLIGRLQTERDRARVLDGLEGAVSAAGQAIDRARLDAILSGLGNRVFLMHDVHEDAPVLFQTRWTMSYLRGPLTRSQIQLLTPDRGGSTRPALPAHDGAPAPREDDAAPHTRARAVTSTAGPGSRAPAVPPAPVAATTAAAPPSDLHRDRGIVPHEVREVWLPVDGAGAPDARLGYRPALLAAAQLHYVLAKAGLDHWRKQAWLLPLPGTAATPDWSEAEPLGELPEADPAPDDDALFSPVPAAAVRPGSYAAWAKTLAGAIHRDCALEIQTCPALGLTARPDEDAPSFRIRLAHACRENLDAEKTKLLRQYGPRLERLAEEERRAAQRIERESAEYARTRTESLIAIGSSVLGALLGRKVASASNVGRAASAARSVGRAARQRGDVSEAGEGLETIRARRSALEAELAAEEATLAARFGPDSIETETIRIAPRKTDLAVEASLAWVPFRIHPDGRRTGAIA